MDSLSCVIGYRLIREARVVQFPLLPFICYWYFILLIKVYHFFFYVQLNYSTHRITFTDVQEKTRRIGFLSKENLEPSKMLNETCRLITSSLRPGQGPDQEFL